MSRTFPLTAFGLAALTLMIDQAIKFLAITKIPLTGIFIIRQDWLMIKLAMTQNNGMAFSLAPSRFLTLAAIVITLGIIIALTVKLFQSQNKTLGLAIAILFGAALSNLCDRIWRSGVIDFFSVSLYNFTWPSFNAADVFITVTAILLIIKWPPHQSLRSGAGQAR